MSITLPTTITINAPREVVWAVLTDFPNYGAWSNFARVDGVAQEGTKLAMRMPGMSFTSTVTVATENSQLQWSANILSDKIFLGQHTFTLEDSLYGKTVLTNSELFAGFLVKPFERLFASTTRPNGYDLFNRALKTRVETVAVTAAAHG
jgi:hypothetical protein